MPTFVEDYGVHNEDTMIRFITLYVLLPHDPNDPAIKKKYKVGEDDKHNDCLFNAIVLAFDYQFNLMPKKICKPWKFKEYLGYDRNDKIELSMKLFEELEELMNCSFIVTGKFTYT